MITNRPFVLLKIATSLDGYLDDNSLKRIVFSSPEDILEVDQLRAEADAILVGAGTIRKDNPRLLIRSEELEQLRLAQGKSRHPIKVTYSQSGNLPLECNFFCLGESKKIVYLSKEAVIKENLNYCAEVVRMELSPTLILNDLVKHGVKKLLIEGGAKTAAWFLKENLVDEIRIAIAPYFLGKKGSINWGDNFLEKYSSKKQIIDNKKLNDMLILGIQ